MDGFSIDAKDFRWLDDGAPQSLSARENHFTGFGVLLGEDYRHSVFQDSRFFPLQFL